ncbi:MAG: bifunctional phosphoribosylaminoimidazolecarboxamide formyltransferase/IMP cyclohydrolase [Planctomycetes bacterium]|nr:bifunctional phosphoribosylaminoimidazolecarboxamide formyltransferase/IMP cyclohydrolase [Planctomycetota bacterium]
MGMTLPTIKNALISVSDKLGVADFSRGLAAAGVEIYSTGGTRRHLESEGVAVKDISAYTGFPEMMDGRLKTLHPKVFGGILCRHDRPDDMQALDDHGIETFALVVVNLYPFEATIARQGVTVAEAIEQIDIGGPSLVRAAAKNHAFATIATDPSQYAEILSQVTAEGNTTLDLRRWLAGEAFANTAQYDRTIADYFAAQESAETFPATMNLSLRRKATLRYGENPHQQAALYSVSAANGANLIAARQLSGKELSYNNLLDLDSALSLVRSLCGSSAVVLKHSNPCGAASAQTAGEAIRQAMAGDPVSAFGSVLGFNCKLDAAAAEVLAEPGHFIEAIVAPDFSPEAIEILTTRPKWKANVRLMEVGPLESSRTTQQVRQIAGGLLVQDSDVLDDPEGEWTVPTKTQPTDQQMQDLRFAWAVVRHVKSNAIVLCKDRTLWGTGAGQMSRVDSVELSIRKAGDRTAGSVLGSDAFFPFGDSIHMAAEAGIAAFIQPGGSRRDDEVIAACDQHGLPMVITGRRHFRH